MKVLSVQSEGGIDCLRVITTWSRCMRVTRQDKDKNFDGVRDTDERVILRSCGVNRLIAKDNNGKDSCVGGSEMRIRRTSAMSLKEWHYT